MASTSNSAGIGQAYITQSRRRLAACHERIRHCLDQVTDEQIWWRPTGSMNSIANIILHLCGNVTQWIVAGIRRSPDARNRPQEFAERAPVPKAELLRRLDAMVREADATLAGVTEAQLLELRRIQGFEETILAAVYDCVTHFNGHTQEIVFMTRLQLKDGYRFAWKPQTVEQGAASGGA